MLSPNSGDPQLMSLSPGRTRPGPGRDPLRDGRVAPMADDDLPGAAQAGADEAELTIPVRRLVQVHEVHVDRAPREIAVELRV